MEKENRDYFKYGILAIIIILAIVSLFGISTGIDKYLYPALLIIGIITIYLYNGKININPKKNQSKYKKYIYLIILLIILISSLAIKLPYFENSLTRTSFVKYQEYVEPAQYMQQSGNLLEFNYKYLANPIINPPIKSINHLPIFEYGLFLTYKLLPFNSIEFNTHLFASLMGIILLVSIFLFSRKFINDELSLIFTLAIAFSPIFNLSSFLTVGDTPMLSLLFFSLLSLQIYFENKENSNKDKKNNNKYLILSSLLLSLSILTKATSILISIPFLIFIFAHNKSKVSNLINYILLTTLASLLLLFILRNYMIYPFLSFLGLILSVLAIIYLFKKSALFESYMQDKLEKINSLDKNKYKIGKIAISIIIFILLYYLIYNNLLSYSLANSFSIFNIEIYKTIITALKDYLTPAIFWVSLAGIAIIPLFNRKNKLPLTILVTSIIYLIILSRILFFHDYYQLIIIVSLCLFFSLFIYSLSSIQENKIFKIISIISLLLLLLPISYNSSQSILDNKIDFTGEAGQALDKLLKENQFFIAGGNAPVLTLYSNRSHIPIQNLKTDEITSRIRQSSFSEVMEELNITYFVTTNQQPDYYRIVALYDKNLQVDPERDEIIQYLLGEREYTYNEFEKRTMISETLNLPDAFKLEGQIGNFRFFRIV